MQLPTARLHQHDAALDRAAALLAKATDVVVTAGAGMSVDSGLPDYRGTKGFWREYPVLEGMGVSFEELNQPVWFDSDPALAWGFLAHCHQMYRRTTPHAGYEVLRRLETAHGKRVRIFTSNIDAAFVKAGFDLAQVYECHGTFRLLQCTVDACAERHTPWPAGDAILELPVDPKSLRVTDTAVLPRCPRCGALARPNVFLFEDPRYAIVDNLRRQRQSEADIVEMLRGGGGGGGGCASSSHAGELATGRHRRRVVVIEGGSGPTVPTVRRFGEYCHDAGAALVRINLRESDLPERMAGAPDAVSLPMTCADALMELEHRMTLVADAAESGAVLPCPDSGDEASPSSLLQSSNPFERLREDELIV
jgi:NAD-dependent SIR2 family protein deacetylase